MSLINEDSDKLSTPKRRRLGLRNPLRPVQGLTKDVNRSFTNSTPLHSRVSSTLVPQKCESPPLPCNQIEYLCDSGSSVNDIPCTPGAFESCFFKDVENWDSFIAGKNDSSKENVNKDEEVSKKPKLETKHEKEISSSILTSRCEKLFRDEIEESFDILHHSIVNINNENDTSTLFETKDSFLLDIRESGIIAAEESKKEQSKSSLREVNYDSNTFYGLPMIVKGLFKTYRNIEKFYDWQEECLNLKSIRERRNLIYALPTSGGKTLVAEVLMLREVVNRKRNALFILPFVAIVQEKIWALAPFALQLEFLVEEYAAGKGHIPPKKRRKKNSIYIATIEKGLALVRSLIELNRLDEIGLIVVDELHLIGESGRGSTLEMLLTTVIFANKGIQIVGMSATIGNLPDIAKFLNADIFEKQFRPVELTEYVKLGDTLYKMIWKDGLEIVPDRKLEFDYSAAGSTLDPDFLGGLVSEVAPKDSCLIFCPTKRNCENVAALLCNVQRREMTNHRVPERVELAQALRSEGASTELVRSVRFGVAFHHAGLGAEERGLLEQGFRSGVISALCCTSTLAAGVNLPARRVVVRAPRVGRAPLPLAAYRQMAGRAGRAGVCDAGESILLCNPREWPEVRRILGSGLEPATSRLRPAASALLLSAVALKLANTKSGLKKVMDCTLLAVGDGPENMEDICEDSIQSLIKSGALEMSKEGSIEQLVVSKLGNAAIQGCMELETARLFLKDLELASHSLVMQGALHLLFLVTPQDVGVRPDYRHFYSLYCQLDEEGVRTAAVLGITEVNAIRMVTGKPITNIPESTLCRFYVALMLRDLWRQVPFHAVAEKYNIGRGTIQQTLSTVTSRATSAQTLCEGLQLWGFASLFGELAPRLRSTGTPGLDKLMELPAVKKPRAMQLVRAGYRSVEEVARADVTRLAAAVQHLSRTAAQHLISAARVMLIEKVENLRAEAEDVMDGLNF